MLQPSELILNPDGSIYHLHLRPGQVAETILLVGDPDRVGKVSQYFDHIEHREQKREFVTHTGSLGNRRLTVVSTGIGTDNIDIVLNELDALFNIDFGTKTVKKDLVSLRFIRIGTSGSLSVDIPVDNFLASAYGAGIDNLMTYYKVSPSENERALAKSLLDFTTQLGTPLHAAVAEGSQKLREAIGQNMHTGITLTSPGFYAPQGRTLRAGSVFQHDFFDKIGGFRFGELSVTNFEMETSGIYGLSKLLGHEALSCNAILANRIHGTFSKDPNLAVDRLIRQVLQDLTNL